jgi:hypothetical protein
MTHRNQTNKLTTWFLTWVAGHTASLEPFEPRSTPVQGCGVWSHWTCGGPRALPRSEAGFGVTGCMTTPELSRTGRLGLVLWDTRQCIFACPVSRHSFGAFMRGYLVCRVPTNAY